MDGEVKNIIIKSFNEKKNSHAFLLVTNNIQKCELEVKDIIKNIIDIEDTQSQKLIDTENHPDVIFIRPDGKEIKTESIMNLLNLFTTKPLIINYKIYVIISADKMNLSSANKILKFLEEPEENIIGFFITEELSQILPTIKSRCEVYNFSFTSNSIIDILDISEKNYEKYFNDTVNLIMKLNSLPSYILVPTSKEFSSMEREDLLIIMKIIKKIYTLKFESLTGNLQNNEQITSVLLNNISDTDLNTVVNKIKILDNIIDYLNCNVNKDLVINKLFLQWK